MNQNQIAWGVQDTLLQIRKAGAGNVYAYLKAQKDGGKKKVALKVLEILEQKGLKPEMSLSETSMLMQQCKMLPYMLGIDKNSPEQVLFRL